MASLSHRSLPIVAVLLVPLLAGCISPGTPPADGADGSAVVDVPPPAAGATYAYEGDDGSRLVVTVNGTAMRLDGALDARRVLWISWTLTTPDRPNRNPSQTTFRFHEMLDPGSGRIVQQVAVCGVRWDGEAPAEQEDDRGCYDERAAVIFSAAGLPGAFGAAPRWNRTLEAGEPVPTPTRPLGLGNATFRYATRPVESGNATCMRLEAGSAPTGVASGLHWTTVAGPVVMCEGMALPVRFTGWDGRTYNLVDHEPGANRLDVDRDPVARAVGPLGARSVSAPLLVADPSDPAKLTVREAHRVAVNRSDPYRRIWDEAEDPLLTGTFFNNASGVSTVSPANQTVSRDTDRTRCVTVQDPARGRMAEACIEKDDADMLEDEPSYEVVEEREASVPVTVNASDIRARQASMRAALDLARRMFGSEPIWWSQRHKVVASPWSPHRHAGEDAYLRRSNEYSLSVFFEDPTPVSSLANIPYQYRFDGPTRTLQWLYVNRSRLPLIDQV